MIIITIIIIILLLLLIIIMIIIIVWSSGLPQTLRKTPTQKQQTYKLPQQSTLIAVYRNSTAP